MGFWVIIETLFLGDHKGVLGVLEKELKLLFDAGALTEAFVYREPLSKGWVIYFSGKKKEEGYILEKKRGGQRVFKTLDAAASMSSEIGFRSIKVNVE